MQLLLAHVNVGSSWDPWATHRWLGLGLGMGTGLGLGMGTTDMSPILYIGPRFNWGTKLLGNSKELPSLEPPGGGTQACSCWSPSSLTGQRLQDPVNTGSWHCFCTSQHRTLTLFLYHWTTLQSPTKPALMTPTLINLPVTDFYKNFN